MPASVLPSSASAGSIPDASVSGSSRLRLPDLLYATDRAAAEMFDSGFDHLLPPGGVPTDDRWFTRLRRDDDIDVWLISWAPGHPTGLHDHGGSLSALTVLSGALDEFRWQGEHVRHRRLEAGDQAAFPLGLVHDVVGARSQAPSPTLSVHAYSPPLTAMTYHKVTSCGVLRRTRTESTSLPEGGA